MEYRIELGIESLPAYEVHIIYVPNMYNLGTYEKGTVLLGTIPAWMQVKSTVKSDLSYLGMMGVSNFTRHQCASYIYDFIDFYEPSSCYSLAFYKRVLKPFKTGAEIVLNLFRALMGQPQNVVQYCWQS
jgi:hypothetical protein